MDSSCHKFGSKLCESNAKFCCLIPVCLLGWTIGEVFKSESAEPLVLAPASLKYRLKLFSLYVDKTLKCIPPPMIVGPPTDAPECASRAALTKGGLFYVTYNSILGYI